MFIKLATILSILSLSFFAKAQESDKNYPLYQLPVGSTLVISGIYEGKNTYSNYIYVQSGMTVSYEEIRWDEGYCIVTTRDQHTTLNSFNFVANAISKSLATSGKKQIRGVNIIESWTDGPIVGISCRGEGSGYPTRDTLIQSFGRKNIEIIEQ